MVHEAAERHEQVFVALLPIVHRNLVGQAVGSIRVSKNFRLTMIIGLPFFCLVVIMMRENSAYTNTQQIQK